MANLGQAFQNVQKYGLVGAVKGAFATPGGYLGENSVTSNIDPAYSPQTHVVSNALTTGSLGAPTPVVRGGPVTAGQAAPAPQPPLTLPPSITQNTNPTGGAAAPIEPTVTWNGRTYQNSHDPQLQADQLTFYTKQHDQNASAIDKAYQSGLITFDERRKQLDQNRQSIIDQQSQASKDYQNNLSALDTSKQNALGGIQASYAQASPDVVQSSQGDYQNQAVNQYNTSLNQLNDTNTANTKSISQALAGLGSAGDAAGAGTAYGDLAGSQQAYNDQYQNNLASNNQNLTGNQDALANAASTYAAQQQAAAGQAAATKSANINQIDSTQLLSGLASTYNTFKGQGATDAEIQSSLKNSLSQKYDPNQVDQVLNFFYGNFLPRNQKAQQGIPQ